MNQPHGVVCADVGEEEDGMTWIGTEMAMSLKTQNGLIGELFVKFVDTNKQNRKGSRWFEDGEIDSCSGNFLIELLRIIKD